MAQSNEDSEILVGDSGRHASGASSGNGSSHTRAAHGEVRVRNLDRMAERCRRASQATAYLKARPIFFLKDGGLWLKWNGCDRVTGVLIPRSCKVRIVGDMFFDQHRRQPWGGNQGAALVHLAKWIRTGKMPISAEGWERWCGPPVMFGNAEFLRAIKEHVIAAAEPTSGRRA